MVVSSSLATLSTAPTIRMATMIPMIPGNMYVSATDVIGCCVGAGVAAAGSTANAVTACEGQ